MISVVIPLYNKEKHISHALESVISQTFRPCEIIVVDDGSTDNSSENARKFVDEGVRVITQDNRGVSAARNRGLFEASSEFVAFLDADDYWLPNHLEVLCSLIRKWPSAALVSSLHLIRRHDVFYAPRSSLPEGWEGVVNDFFEIYASGLSLVNSSTACVNRRVFIESGGFPVDVTRGEDIIAWVRLALRGKVVHKAIPTVVYNQDAENRSALVKLVDPPGSLVYLMQLSTDAELKRSVARGILRLGDRIALMTVSGLCLDGNIASARRIARLMRKTGRIKVSVALYVIMLLPSSILRVVKSLRHRRVAC